MMHESFFQLVHARIRIAVIHTTTYLMSQETVCVYQKDQETYSRTGHRAAITSDTDLAQYPNIPISPQTVRTMPIARVHYIYF